MAVWGWMPQYYVATGAIMGTRDAITQFQIEGNPLMAYYRARYLADMRQNAPEYFLDAVAPSSFAFNDKTLEGVSTFPELESLVDTSYHLVTDIDGVRLYRRNS